ncbi:MAG: endo-1,4-beta-xylanase [Candidatus Acidiferrales bacterium]
MIPKRMRIPFVLIGALLCAMMLSADSSLTLTPSQSPIPSTYFSMNILFHPNNNVPWPAVPFYGWRAWHALWYDLEPQKGQWQFDHLDKLVAQAQQHNSQLMLILAYSPQWASTQFDPKSDWQAGTAGPLRDMDDWRNYVRTVATRYKGKIHVYEIWNEPDRSHAWLGDMETMLTMVREASKILKEVDPNVTVVSPSPETDKAPAWLNEFLSKGGGQYVDVIGYHFYVQERSPEAMVPIIQNVRAIMEKNGVGNKPLWDTEAGWLSPNFFPDDQQAAYLARAFVLNWAAGVDRYYWYAWDSHKGSQIEMVRAGNASLTPAAKAFGTIQDWMTGAVMKRCVTSENHNWVCEFTQNGGWKFIVWNTDGDRSFKLAPNWNAKQITKLDGTFTQINSDSVPIGIQPVLIQ